ncbi:MAG: hypothetical protein A2X34_10690 [Elusimicrobia bacterium GWC2_51_8]|nr:MAG: hypothetical protein A2X33_09385 [Elusimicrobia bacterium GWA2_51_34]OGR62227.1 MAG: hypothetical protein A2X34_10690 [Elusimicrobia bacterium GWC2_51_8]OGR88362.1 MAG: hypothetical protein A2021_01945 [Elusimicrobia bacterium GWF2_52_66]HAF94608.1 hypothetical protein [Elusimicrobiota bacterium]HCE98058.1 hypothetical protein [Elusimicrobiota bacterium]
MPQEYPISVLTPILAMMVNIAAHVAASRLTRGRNQLTCIFYGFITGLIGMLFLAFAGSPAGGNKPDFTGYLLTNVISYTAFAYGYFHFININVASLRIRLLQEIINSPGGLSEKDVLLCYNSEDIIDNRIKRLISSGQLIEKEGYYYLGKNRAFLRLFWLFEILKYAVLGHGNRFLKPVDKKSVPGS